MPRYEAKGSFWTLDPGALVGYEQRGVVPPGTASRFASYNLIEPASYADPDNLKRKYRSEASTAGRQRRRHSAVDSGPYPHSHRQSDPFMPYQGVYYSVDFAHAQNIPIQSHLASLRDPMAGVPGRSQMPPEPHYMHVPSPFSGITSASTRFDPLSGMSDSMMHAAPPSWIWSEHQRPVNSMLFPDFQ
jgi:hypothetical protein